MPDRARPGTDVDALAADIAGDAQLYVSTVTEGVINPVAEGVRAYALDPDHARALWTAAETWAGERF